MSCILRVSGVNFDVDLFIKDKDLSLTQLYRKGMPCFPNAKPDGPKNKKSGFGIEVSSADFNEFELQIHDAINYLSNKSDFMSEINMTKEIEHVELDFGVSIQEPFINSYTFPKELVTLAGGLGVSLSISTYPIGDKENEI